MHVDIKTGLSCNNKCVHCVMQPLKDSLETESQSIEAPLDAVLEEIQSAFDNDYKTITLTGGEITLRNDLDKIIIFALKLNLNITIQTNARELANVEKQQMFEFYPPSKINFVIAIHGDSSSTHDNITREKGSFNETIKAVSFLNSLNYQLTSKVVLSNYNIDNLYDTVVFLFKQNFIKVIIAFPHAEEFSEKIFRAVVPRYKEVQEQIKKISKIKLASNQKITYETIPFCKIDNSSVWKNSQDVAYCQHSMKKQKHTKIEMPFNSCSLNWDVERLDSKVKPSSCKECFMDYVCEGVWAEYAEYFGLKEFKPISDLEKINVFEQSLLV